jgi:hypothetical protein
MADSDKPPTRAERLRARVAQLKKVEPAAEEPQKPVRGPRPGESPHAFVERRMRETLKKKDKTAER